MPIKKMKGGKGCALLSFVAKKRCKSSSIKWNYKQEKGKQSSYVIIMHVMLCSPRGIAATSPFRKTEQPEDLTPQLLASTTQLDLTPPNSRARLQQVIRRTNELTGALVNQPPFPHMPHADCLDTLNFTPPVCIVGVGTPKKTINRLFLVVEF